MEDTPKVIVRVPPLLYGAPIAAGLAIDWAFPLPLFPQAPQYVVGFGLLTIAGLIMPFVMREYGRANTNFDPGQPAVRLITGGPYRYSRNPSYLALALLHIGLGIAIDSAWILAGFLPAMLFTHYGVILPEERYLEAKFGERYIAYKRRVRRWL